MILSQPQVLAATLPQLINTFGAASVILSPILNMLLFAAAVYLVFHILNFAKQSNLFSYIFAAFGVLKLSSSIVDYLLSSNNEVQRPTPPYVRVHIHREENFFSPSYERDHNSNQSRQMHGRS